MLNEAAAFAQEFTGQRKPGTSLRKARNHTLAPRHAHLRPSDCGRQRPATAALPAGCAPSADQRPGGATPRRRRAKGLRTPSPLKASVPEYRNVEETLVVRDVPGEELELRISGSRGEVRLELRIRVRPAPVFGIIHRLAGARHQEDDDFVATFEHVGAVARRGLAALGVHRGDGFVFEAVGQRAGELESVHAGFRGFVVGTLKPQRAGNRAALGRGPTHHDDFVGPAGEHFPRVGDGFDFKAHFRHASGEVQFAPVILEGRLFAL